MTQTPVQCVVVRNPFAPARAREIRTVPAGTPLSALAIRGPHIILVNGDPVLRQDWSRPVCPGDVVTVVALPAGGGGGSNPLRMVLMIAVSVFAPYVAGGINAALGAGLGKIGMQVLTAGVGFAGSALVNALVPPPKPPTARQAQQLAAPSPTYSLQAQGNTARLDEAIPVQYGRLRAFPDFAAQPYVEYAGNEQYLYQLLCLGQGEYDIEGIYIEDTPIANFEEISVETIPPGGALTLFPGNVATSGEVSGQELAGVKTATYIQSGTTITVTQTGHALAIGNQVYLDFTSGTAVDGAFVVTGVASEDIFTVSAPTSSSTSGNVTVHRYAGSFVANAAGTVANHLGLDFVFPRGLYYAEDNGSLSTVSVSFAVEARAINDAGQPIGGWTVLASETYSDRTTTPIRISRRFAVTPGRYEVRVRRLDSKQTDTRYGHEILWAGLRAYLPETRQFGGVTLIAMRMRASNQLSGMASRKINVICTRKLPVWDGSTWSAPVATRSIAWALADACRNPVYGASLPDARIDLAALLDLDAIWQSRGDTFDARFDAALTWWEAAQKIATAGRAKVYIQGGVLRVARDGPASVPVALYSMRNIVRASLSIDYIMPSPDTADAVEALYLDQTVWQPQRVIAALPGSESLRPAKIDLFGVVNRDQAWREALYQAASNRYRRRVVKFTTELEGFIPSLGDLIAIQHDMPGWGQHAEAKNWDAGTRTLTVTEPLVWGAGAHYIGLRRPDGSLSGPYAVTPGAQADQVILAQAPDFEIALGTGRERTHISFGWSETWRQLAKVIAIRPRGLYEVEIEAINEDPAVHTAETGQTPPPVQTSQLATLYTAPVIANLSAASSTTSPGTALLTWTPAPGAESYQIEMAQGTDPYDPGMSWTRIAETSASNFAVTALYGAQTLIRIRAVGLVAGPWVVLFYGSSADYMWINDAAPMWDVNSATPMWRY